MNKMAIAFDFDGVIHEMNDGWRNGEIYGRINNDVIQAIYELNKMNIPVFICSSRDTFFFNDTDYIGVTNRKLPAQLYIDDRAFKYTGEDKKGILLAAIGKEIKTDA